MKFELDILGFPAKSAPFIKMEPFKMVGEDKGEKAQSGGFLGTLNKVPLKRRKINFSPSGILSHRRKL